MTQGFSFRRPVALARGLAAGLALVLAGCGGGGGELLPPLPGITCSSLEQKVWLADYFDDWYFWRDDMPQVSPYPDRSLAEFFKAQLYSGSNPAWPVADRWSRMEDSEVVDRFFNEGRTLGYGLMVAGLEIAGQPERPLRVRYVEPGSDAAAQGLRRGDELLTLNGRAAAELVAANDFALLTPAREGDTLRLSLRRDGAVRELVLGARVYDLQPVTRAQVLSSPAGRRVGYVHVKDMIDRARPGLEAAFAQFAAAGVQDLVLDLRYNGGGLVSLATTLASYVGGARTDGQDFARLRYNSRRDRSNETFRFSRPADALGLARVYVLTGPRTCSASELVINGLRPFVDVVVIGGTTCGKPVGFQPVSRCDKTFSVVNFEAVNARDQGRYIEGLGASCAVADDLGRELGSADEALLAAARSHADSGRCPAPTVSAERRQALQAAERRQVHEPAEVQGMRAR